MSLNKNKGALDPRIADERLMRKMASLTSSSTSSSRKQSENQDQQLLSRPLPRSDSMPHKTAAQTSTHSFTHRAQLVSPNHPYTATQSQTILAHMHNVSRIQTPPQKTSTHTTYNLTPHLQKTSQTVTTQLQNHPRIQKEQLPSVAQTQNVQRRQTTLQGLSTQTRNPPHVQQFDSRFVSDVVRAVEGPGFNQERKSFPLTSGPSVSSASAQLAAPEKNLIYDTLLRIEAKMTSFDIRLTNLEDLATKIYTTTKGDKKKKSTVEKDRPAFLPFSTKEGLLLFDNASEDEYNAFVDYLTYLGGGNTSAAASTYFRKCIEMTEDLFLNLTWTGSKKQKLVPLKNTRFSEACEEAMSRHENVFSKPDNMEFSHVMTKALKSVKESFRRKRQAEDPVMNDKEAPKRRREEPNNNAEFNDNEDNDNATQPAADLLSDEEDARALAREEARRTAEEEAKRTAEEEARRAAREEARRAAREEARRAAQEEARRAAREEARRAAREARLAAEEKVRLAAEEEARLAAEDERAAAEEQARACNKKRTRVAANSYDRGNHLSETVDDSDESLKEPFVYGDKHDDTYQDAQYDDEIYSDRNLINENSDINFTVNSNISLTENSNRLHDDYGIQTTYNEHDLYDGQKIIYSPNSQYIYITPDPTLTEYLNSNTDTAND